MRTIYAYVSWPWTFAHAASSGYYVVGAHAYAREESMKTSLIPVTNSNEREKSSGGGLFSKEDAVTGNVKDAGEYTSPNNVGGINAKNPSFGRRDDGRRKKLPLP